MRTDKDLGCRLANTRNIAVSRRIWHYGVACTGAQSTGSHSTRRVVEMAKILPVTPHMWTGSKDLRNRSLTAKECSVLKCTWYSLPP